MEILVGTDTEAVELFPTYSPPELRHLLYRGINFVSVCDRSLPPEVETSVTILLIKSRQYSGNGC